MLQVKKLLRVNGKVLDEEEASKYAKEQSVLSWKWCNKCQMNVPPRSHHCKVYSISGSLF